MTGVRGSILYVGGFVLPDKNAAAQRVVANARLFAELGFDVVFLNYSRDVSEPRKVEYFGFECFECPASEWDVTSRVDVDRIDEILSARANIRYVIAYNYPSLSLFRLIRFCRAKGIKCIGDVTEWYRARDVSLPKMALKYTDTTLRMRLLHPRMDGLIVISEFLEHYYETDAPVVLLPPLVDAKDPKWAPIPAVDSKTVSLVYAGKPSKTKERLDLIVNAVNSLPSQDHVRLDIVGITSDEYAQIYGCHVSCPRVVFHGRVPHETAVGLVKVADYSIIVRDDNLVTRAGFPTKFVESVTCGTPVICNDNSDLRSWVERYGCGFVLDEKGLSNELHNIILSTPPIFDRNIFDYRRFCAQVADFFGSISEKKEN